MALKHATQSAQDAEKLLLALDDSFDTENLEDLLVRLLSAGMYLAEDRGEDFGQCLVMAEEAYELEAAEG
jgi:hypothetical protein